jgi:hypothetical protein
MHLIEILLPLRDADGEAFPAQYYDDPPSTSPTNSAG